ncbi:uncharacterized protein LOC141598813 [Silene latifolia]|uniref:uncharacterized protein LOC141598813 n=1 Tax=Silene latifolia TaxID=37657 RepID=UPI003D76C6B0
MEGVMKQKSVGSSCRVEKPERVKEKILVHSLGSEQYHPLPEYYQLSRLEQQRPCSRTEFHLVDLKTNEIHLHYAPSLLQYAAPSSMVAVDDFIYVFGGARHISESESEKLKLFQPLYHKKVFFGGSCLQLSFDQSNTEEWYPAPIPAENRIYPSCTTLFDKIYVFGDEYLVPEVLDPAVGQWKHLFPPSHLVGCKISPYALPDPSNGRVLMRLSDGQLPSPTIYAFIPKDNSSGGEWESISVDAQGWTHVAAVVDNVIYFHSHKFPSVLRAFDLASGAWLKVYWEKSFDDGLDMNQITMYFDDMFSLGNKILCFAVWTPIYDPSPLPETADPCEIVFRKFRVEQSDATVKLVPLPTLSFKLPATCKVYKFLPV